jgi:hypothetical protein
VLTIIGEPFVVGSSVTPGEVESQARKERAPLHGIAPPKDGVVDRSLHQTDTLMKYYNILYVALVEV